MKLYLDNCCWNRPFDGYTDSQSVGEVFAIKAILAICKRAGYAVFGSQAVTYEIDRMRNKKPEKWADVRGYYERTITGDIEQTPDIDTRAQGFYAAGLTGQDHYHLAFAEAAGVDVLLTTDNDFIDICASKNLSIVNVMNPINFLPEVQKWAQ